MRTFLIFFGSFVLLLALLCALPFTPPGNALLKSFLQKQIDKSAPISVEISEFKLNFYELDLKLHSKHYAQFAIHADFSLYLRDFTASLNAEFKDISIFSDMAGAKLAGSFRLDAQANGKFENFEISAMSDIAGSMSSAKARMVNFRLAKLDADIKHAQIAQLAAMWGKSAFYNANLDILAKLDSQNLQTSEFKFSKFFLSESQDFTLKDFVGDINAQISNIKPISSAFVQHFGRAPKLSANGNLDIFLNSEKIIQNLKLDSENLKLDLSAQMLKNSGDGDANFTLKADDLLVFAPLFDVHLSGDFFTSGRIQTQGESLQVDLSSKIAGGSAQTEFKKTADSDNISIKTNGKNINFKRLLKQIDQIEVLDAFENVADDKFELNFVAALDQQLNIEISEFSAYNDHASFTSANILIEPHSLKMPFNLKIANLQKISKSLRGSSKISGVYSVENGVKKTEFSSYDFDGRLNGVVESGILRIQASELDAQKVFVMLNIKPILVGKIDGALEYDLNTSMGSLKLSSKNSHLAQNTLFEQIKSYTGVDGKNEFFNEIVLNAKLNFMNNLNVLCDFDANSKNLILSTRNTKLIFDKNYIDSEILLVVGKSKANVKLFDKLDSPSMRMENLELDLRQIGNLLGGMKF